MERLKIEKLIVISDNERASREVTFEDGLNIIIGRNKNGKSSIIKSIFYAFGCKTEMDKSWLELIDTYILKFKYGIDNYYIMRKGERYCIYEEKIQIKLIIDTDSFSEFSECLVKNIFGITAELVDKNGNITSFIPPILFRYQYIDQESGWAKLGESFLNMKYIKDWKTCGIKFVIGYQNEEYYNIKKNKEIISDKIKELKVKEEHFIEMVNNIKSYKQDGSYEISFESSNDLKQKVQHIMTKLSSLEREKVSIEKIIIDIKNKIYINSLEIKMLKSSIDDLEADYKYACNEDEEIICPTCGKIYCNSVVEKIEIVKDIQSGEELISYYRNEVSKLQYELDAKLKEKSYIKLEINKLNLELNKIDKEVNVTNYYKSKGRSEIIEASEAERVKVSLEIDQKNTIKIGYEEKIKNLLSRKRQAEIKREFIKVYEKVLSKANINTQHIKLRNFEQVLEHTGSEKPRIILSYFVALYLYNLSRANTVFNFLVIDTPNQQGQDSENLKNIDSILELLLDNKGQVILGTERITGYEELASKIIELTENRRCLTTDKYKEHKGIYMLLESIS